MDLLDRIFAEGRVFGRTCPEPTVEQMRQVGQVLRGVAERRRATADRDAA